MRFKKVVNKPYANLTYTSVAQPVASRPIYPDSESFSEIDNRFFPGE